MGFDFCQRPRNAAATRGAILAAASKRFSAESYEQVGMRDVAGDVGVDAALISRYFGSKEELFLAVLNDCGEASDLMEGDRSDFGRRFAHELVYGARKDGKMNMMLIMLRSAASPKAADVLKQSADSFYTPLSDWLGGEDAKVRTRILAGLLMGLSVGRDISGGFDLTEAECEDMCRRLSILLQALVDG